MKPVFATFILMVTALGLSGCMVAQKYAPWHPDNAFERTLKKAGEGYKECQEKVEAGELEGVYDLYDCRAAVVVQRHKVVMYPYKDLVQNYVDVVREQAMQVDCKETTMSIAKEVMAAAHASWKKVELERCLVDTYEQDLRDSTWTGQPRRAVRMWEHDCRPTSDGKTSLDHVNFR